MSTNPLSLEGISLETDAKFPEPEKRGPLVRLNGEAMVENNIEAGTQLAIARFEEAVESKRYPGQIDYSFRGGNDSLIYLRGNASVKRQMAAINPGDLVRITYEGTYTPKSGPGKGTVCHGFKVESALNAE